MKLGSLPWVRIEKHLLIDGTLPHVPGEDHVLLGVCSLVCGVEHLKGMVVFYYDKEP